MKSTLVHWRRLEMHLPDEACDAGSIAHSVCVVVDAGSRVRLAAVAAARNRSHKRIEGGWTILLSAGQVPNATEGTTGPALGLLASPSRSDSTIVSRTAPAAPTKAQAATGMVRPVPAVVAATRDGPASNASVRLV
jgi:hypothetical protein